MELEAEISIARSPEEIWKFFTTADSWKQWWGGALLKVDPGWTEGGSLVWELGRPSTLIRVVPGSEVVIKHVWSETTWRFTDQGGSTAVGYQEKFVGGASMDAQKWRSDISAKLSSLKNCLEPTRQSSAPSLAASPSWNVIGVLLAGSVVTFGIGTAMTIAARSPQDLGIAPLFSLASYVLGGIAGYAIARRRNRSGWWAILGFLSFIGAFIVLLLVRERKPGAALAPAVPKPDTRPMSPVQPAPAAPSMPAPPIARVAATPALSAEAEIDRKVEMFRQMGFKVGGVEAAKQAAREADAARPNETWFKDAVTEMVSIYRQNPDGFVRSRGGASYRRLREIGEMLNAKGGMSLMRAAHAEFSRECGVRGAPRNLEFMWDGVGSWRG